MIRKNIYLTEKQVEFITKFIKEEGGGTETDVVRQALDDFIQAKSLPYAQLICRSLNFKYDFYIELSGRATGKTYRLIKDATQYLDNDSKHKVNIVTSNSRTATHIKKQIGEYYKNRIFLNEKWMSDDSLNIKCYYDEFDCNKDLVTVDTGGYYCSTVKTRNLGNLDRKNDFLLKLLEANKYKYLSYANFGALTGINLSLEDKVKNIPGFESEYENRIFKFE